MEEAVEEAMLTEHSDDPVLPLLIGLAVTSITENRPLFPNPFDEPVFYRRYFRKWVEDGLEEVSKIHKALEEAQKPPGEQ